MKTVADARDEQIRVIESNLMWLDFMIDSTERYGQKQHLREIRIILRTYLQELRIEAIMVGGR